MHVLLQYQSKSYYIIGQEVYYSIGRFITLSGSYYIIGRFLLHYRAVITVSGVYYIIGWYRLLSGYPSWNRHVDCIVKKAAKRVYMLYQLKRAGISQLDLVTVYISVVRPVLEYACPVWHTNLPKYLSDSIELIQNRALKSIFPGKSYNDILNDTGLRTLKERRDVLCMKYFAEIQGSAHKLNGLLPALRKVDYDLRPGFNRYPLARYRTNRYGNSLIPWGLSHWQ